MCCGMDCEGAPREPGIGVSGSGVRAVSRRRAKKKENQGNLATSREALIASHAGARKKCNL
ncbi:Uncharacterised protein [[Eubacterium] contortum]|uniref:Uncharacterized protein n=1 Tax=Faecalicatena contorta TaxID=39482 RepID=A0A174GM87_9FIRM|nr:Uncharacterised protein [[Eubacterium] contortum] [Faecalicatena contorta]